MCLLYIYLGLFKFIYSCVTTVLMDLVQKHFGPLVSQFYSDENINGFEKSYIRILQRPSIAINNITNTFHHSCLIVLNKFLHPLPIEQKILLVTVTPKFKKSCSVLKTG